MTDAPIKLARPTTAAPVRMQRPVPMQRPTTAAPAAQASMVRGNGLPMELGEMTGETGRLTDPLQDRAAWREASKQDAIAAQLRLSGGFGDTLDKFGEGVTMGADRPIEGAVSYLSGNGYQRGKAVNAYRDDIRDKRLGGMGTAVGLAGSVFSPQPSGKLSLIREMLLGGGQAAVEGMNNATEGDNRNVGDIAKDAIIGSGVTGALSGLGRAVRPAEAIDTPKTQRALTEGFDKTKAALGTDRVESSGLAVRDALIKEQGALKKGGKDAMKAAVKGDFSIADDAGSSFMKDIDTAYSGVTTAPIPITPQGTPAASAFRDSIAQTAAASGDHMSLASIDELRVKARGLRSTAANATDKAALQNLEKSLDRMVDTKVASGAFVGDKAYNEAYRAGRSKYEAAMKISDLPGVKQMLKDETIPGAAIADSLLSINTSAKSKAPARLVKTIVDTLGPNSESLDTVRKGVLSTMFEAGVGTPETQAKLLKTLERNETLIGDLFSPDQVSELASIRADLTNAIGAVDKAKAGAAAEKRVHAFLTKATGGLGKAMKNPAASGAVTAVASGSNAAGMSVTALLGALNVAASRPVRAAVSTATDMGAKAAGRQAAQNPDIRSVVPNPRDAIINQLGGVQ